MRSYVENALIPALCAVTLLSAPGPGQAQTPDLLGNRAVLELVEEALIADLMLRSCQGVRASESGAADLEARADRLARQAGFTPEEGAAVLNAPQNKDRIERGALSRLARMGARPEDLNGLCRLALSVAGGPGLLGSLLIRD